MLRWEEGGARGEREGEGQLRSYLRCHDIIRPTIGLARNDCNLGNRGLGICVEQLCAVLDDAAVLLAGAGEEPWHVHKCDEWDVE